MPSPCVPSQGRYVRTTQTCRSIISTRLFRFSAYMHVRVHAHIHAYIMPGRFQVILAIPSAFMCWVIWCLWFYVRPSSPYRRVEWDEDGREWVRPEHVVKRQHTWSQRFWLIARIRQALEADWEHQYAPVFEVCMHAHVSVSQILMWCRAGCSSGSFSVGFHDLDTLADVCIRYVHGIWTVQQLPLRSDGHNRHVGVAFVAPACDAATFRQDRRIL